MIQHWTGWMVDTPLVMAPLSARRCTFLLLVAVRYMQQVCVSGMHATLQYVHTDRRRDSEVIYT